jgi:hypothetical protein
MDGYPLGPPQFEPRTETVETVESPAPGRWRRTAAAATGAIALAGVVAGGVVAIGGGTSAASPGAGAQTSTTTTQKPRPTPEDLKAKRGERLDQALQPLVDDGTITDAQRDAVVKRLEEAAPEGRMGFRGPDRGFGPGLRGIFGAGLDTAAKALGMSTDDLRAELRDGKSIADVAGEKKVSTDAVIDALVAEAKAKVAQLDLPEGRTAPTDQQIRDAITKLVNGDLGFGHGHRGDWRGPGAPEGSAPDAPTTTAPAAPSTTAPSAPTTTEVPSTTAPTTTTTN